MKTTLFNLCTASAIGLLTNTASAVFLAPTTYPDRITDDFNRDDNLNSSQALTGQMWNASSWSTDGAQLQISGTGVANIGSGFLTTERTYTLSLAMSFTAQGNGRLSTSRKLAFGFTTAPTLNSPGAGTLGGSIWHDDGNLELIGDGSSSAQNLSIGSSGTRQFELSLTTGQTLADSELVWLVDGNQVGNSVEVDAGLVNGVFLESLDGGVGTLDNLNLSEANAVPEPSSLFLSGTAFLGLLLRRRR